MQKTRDAFLRLIKAAKEIRKIGDALRRVGLGDDALFTAYGDIVEAIDSLIGAEFGSCEIETTVAYSAVNSWNNEDAADMLMAEFERFNTIRPHTIEREEMREMVHANGGYMRPEGDWT